MVPNVNTEPLNHGVFTPRYKEIECYLFRLFIGVTRNPTVPVP